MAAVRRLLTLVEVAGEVADPRQMSVFVRHEAVLADGRRLLLLGDRGWTSSGGGNADIWSTLSVEEVENTARTVVGPDEPFGGRTHEEMETDHWSYLADVLRQQGCLSTLQSYSGYPTMSSSESGCSGASAGPS